MLAEAVFGGNLGGGFRCCGEGREGWLACEDGGGGGGQDEDEGGGQDEDEGDGRGGRDELFGRPVAGSDCLLLVGFYHCIVYPCH